MIWLFLSIGNLLLLSGILLTLRRGFVEVIKGLESIDERLSRMER